MNLKKVLGIGIISITVLGMQAMEKEERIPLLTKEETIVETANQLPKKIKQQLFSSKFPEERKFRRAKKVIITQKDINSLKKDKIKTNSLLNTAITTGNPEMLRFLLKIGVDPNQRIRGIRILPDYSLNVALNPTFSHSVSMVHLLLRYGANPTKTTSTRSMGDAYKIVASYQEEYPDWAAKITELLNKYAERRAK